MATKITQDKIIEINRMYKRLRTYAAVARELGISPGTVKKYVLPDFSEPESPRNDVEIILSEFNPASFYNQSREYLFKLTEEEKIELNELRKEMLI